ncbi:hypothetical protein [Cellulomonas timonensis]|uniref:hypothetical protein n=1 Tax=Cellulomonas timonensis TaxID=1689271 RepID=UPI0008337246|nr:hypothetical protein [Cellulomonas timonensis]
MDTSVLELPAPAVSRLRRPGWRDPRLLAGLAMVAGSVALGSWVVQDAQRTVDVYVARGTITPGSGLAADALGIAQVRLGPGELDRYLTVADGVPDGAVAVRVVDAGELLPRSAVGAAGDLDVRPLAVPVDQTLSQDVVVGSQVDLWEVPEAVRRADGTMAPGAPEALAEGLVVAEVTRPDGAFTTGGSSVVQVLVPKGELPAVLAAVMGEGAVQVMHVPGTGG